MHICVGIVASVRCASTSHSLRVIFIRCSFTHDKKYDAGCNQLSTEIRHEARSNFQIHKALVRLGANLNIHMAHLFVVLN